MTFLEAAILMALGWVLRCESCGGRGLPESHFSDCPRLWRNGGEITGSGDAWYKQQGFTRDQAEDA